LVILKQVEVADGALKWFLKKANCFEVSRKGITKDLYTPLRRE
jgi:hypothetical protein